MLHHFFILRGSLADEFLRVEEWLREGIAKAAAIRRTPEPLDGLVIGLQCGGSDAFSGISGNPLAGAVVHEILRHGGAGVLCETDELVGAEGYILKSARDLPTAQALLRTIERFKERLTWHGVTPESNPSAGNNLRGLYNIVLKSLGAAHKKDPRSRVERVIEYGEPVRGPGFHFMNSPGNDLEGIAGQVASGCNLFLFVTGNGSITNFPFVPTLKITTTTQRHRLLDREMDVNAGRYLDGESMDLLTAETLELVIATASGQLTKGERAGHSQVSIWRNWRQTDESQLSRLRARSKPDGVPVLDRDAAHAALEGISVKIPPIPATVLALGDGRWATERVGLVFPTSLCSTQIARKAAERMNAGMLGREHGLARFAAPVHTEGCGYGGSTMHELLLRTYRGYATHPNVDAALFLEHGCEKIPNDVMRRHLESASISTDRFGWASVQLDGGIARALLKNPPLLLLDEA
ncbi:MAG TPA: UxaA family hydrolase, partial [Opitutaceae bacterium]|nr:UxaA family hydrolase [Opitutaceae bacterium]